MGFIIYEASMGLGDVGVYLSRGYGSVTEEFLYDPQVRASFQQVSCEAVPEDMGA